MTASVSYQRVHTGQSELNGSLLVKYRLAKALTVISLLAIIVMAIYSLFHPSNVKFPSTNKKLLTFNLE